MSDFMQRLEDEALETLKAHPEGLDPFWENPDEALGFGLGRLVEKGIAEARDLPHPDAENMPVWKKTHRVFFLKVDETTN